jgi:chromate transporter
MTVPTPIRLFFRFFRIGLFTVGGGYAMVPIIEHEIAVSENSLSREDVARYVLIAQSAPGPIAVNTALLIGNSLAGPAGAALSALGMILPSVAVILLVAGNAQAIFSSEFGLSAFRGIRATVFSLIVLTALRQGKRNRSTFLVLLAVMWFLALAFFGVSPYMVVLVSMLLGIAREFIKKQ